MNRVSFYALYKNVGSNCVLKSVLQISRFPAA
nr:MAG TPA: hypothetical protein [Caudoviricetes sp.]